MTSPLDDYSRRMLEAQSEIRQIEPARLRALAAFAGCCLLVLIILFFVWHNTVALAIVLPAGVAALYFLRLYKDRGEKWKQLALHCESLERGIERLTHRWQGNGRKGTEFARKGHLYQDDLNVLGEGSLFELLCTTRTEVGASRLASYLLDPATIEESIRRQEAVKELCDSAGLREAVMALGDYRFQDCSADTFRTWQDLPILDISARSQNLILGFTFASVAIGVCIASRALLWSHWLLPLIFLLLVQIVWSWTLARGVRPRLHLLGQLTGALTILQQGFVLLEQQRFESAKLREIVERLRGQQASAAVRRLEKRNRWLDQREKPEFYLLARLLATGTHLVLSSERWRAEHGKNLEAWMEAWSEFEALNCLAGYAYEHPGHVFPSCVKGRPHFEAKELGHPLLADFCVGNNVALGDGARLYIISGANMAGKSTLMRAVGLNAVLAFAGAPMRATEACLSGLTICASIALTDSLAGGKSKFLAEVERIRHTVELGRSNRNVLFLIDEILGGTNSYDRKVAAEIIVKTLLASNGIGVLSTHDLALTEIATNALDTVLLHMASRSSEKPLDFDYRLRPGVSHETNALAIVKMMGII
ncbi:Flp pilus assembly protein TadB [Silvibacterium bohemicum]|uniref:Flp pilus assembly protein TadB n=1 Tax=Silvibacterium bohemicum TaxID=1577686 RepID=A0A841JPM3_9BACT|nr:hypothetical protein [Silvibacterium bohemicum]MBB6143296.1 Flp pilus assembly protein TadB [Silvibacterium bohemicum]